MFQRSLLLLLILSACSTVLKIGDEASPIAPVASSSIYVPLQSATPDATDNMQVARNTATVTETAPSQDIFMTQFRCNYPQRRQVTLQQAENTTANLYLDGFVIVIDNITNLRFSIAPDSTVLLIEADGSSRSPEQENMIGACHENGTPDASLASQPELMVFPVSSIPDCPMIPMAVESIIGYVIANAGGVDSGAFQVRITNGWYNSQISESLLNVDNLPAGSSRLYLFDEEVRSRIDRTSVTIEVDNNHLITEMIEDNNVVQSLAGCFGVT